MHSLARTVPTLVVLLAGSLSACAVAQHTTNAGYQPRFEAAPCPFEASEEVLSQFRCGYLIVPENRDRPDGRQLRLAVAVLSSTSDTPSPDPIMLIPGGPGGSTLRSIANGVRSPLRADRQIIAYDPRGTGFSEPSICADLNQEWQRIGWMGGLDPEERRREQIAALERCRTEVEGEGVDLSGYNTLANALDLDDLRRALGIEEWNLWGLSYGTMVALEALRSTPEGIRSVILDSPVPPNVPGKAERTRGFADAVSRLLELCSEDAACDRVLPDAETRFWEVIEDLDRDPLVLATGGRNGLPDPLVVDGVALAGGAMSALYSSTRRAILPLAVRAAGARNEAFMLGAAVEMLRDPEASERWVNLTVNCYERDGPRSLPSTVPLHERGHALLARIGMGDEPCEAWHRYRVGPEFGEPVESATPTLIFTGEFDPVTNRTYGPAAAVGLERARVVEIPGAGHTEANGIPCTRGLMEDFLDDPERPLDTGCLASLPAPRFVTDPAQR